MRQRLRVEQLERKGHHQQHLQDVAINPVFCPIRCRSSVCAIGSAETQEKLEEEEEEGGIAPEFSVRQATPHRTNRRPTDLRCLTQSFNARLQEALGYRDRSRGGSTDRKLPRNVDALLLCLDTVDKERLLGRHER